MSATTSDRALLIHMIASGPGESEAAIAADNAWQVLLDIASPDFQTVLRSLFEAEGDAEAILD